MNFIIAMAWYTYLNVLHVSIQVKRRRVHIAHPPTQSQDGIAQKTKFSDFILPYRLNRRRRRRRRHRITFSFAHPRPNKLKTQPYLFSLTELHSEVHCVLFNSLAFFTFDSDWDFGATTTTNQLTYQPTNHTYPFHSHTQKKKTVIRFYFLYSSRKKNKRQK